MAILSYTSKIKKIFYVLVFFFITNNVFNQNSLIDKYYFHYFFNINNVTANVYFDNAKFKISFFSIDKNGDAESEFKDYIGVVKFYKNNIQFIDTCNFKNVKFDLIFLNEYMLKIINYNDFFNKNDTMFIVSKYSLDKKKIYSASWDRIPDKNIIEIMKIKEIKEINFLNGRKIYLMFY